MRYDERAYSACSYYFAAWTFSWVTPWSWWEDLLIIYLTTLVSVQLFRRYGRPS